MSELLCGSTNKLAGSCYCLKQYKRLILTKLIHGFILEPLHEKTYFLHMRKQRRRSVPSFSLYNYIVHTCDKFIKGIREVFF